MKIIKSILFLIACASVFSCESLVEGINDNPNKVTIKDVDPVLFLTGAQLANTSNQLGHNMRISSAWSGQLIGYQSLYQQLYRYEITTAESNDIWEQSYPGVLTQVRHIREQLPDDLLLQGICKVMEAHSVGTLAAIFGDIPYSEIINEDIPTPKFDSQVDVFNALQRLLDEAISDLAGAREGRLITQDIYYNGDKNKWLEAAWTLKARYHTLTKEYDQAYAAAQKGISSPENSLLFRPRDTPNREDKNLFNTLLSGIRAGDIGNRGSFLLDLLDEEGAISRNHAKTREQARHSYLLIDEQSASSNEGVAAALEPQPLVSFAENLLTLAEMGARTVSFDEGLKQLNEWRAYLNSGEAFRILNPDDMLRYEAFTAADFQPGGIENPDNTDAASALLREIIEERYVSFFGQFLPFHDARRLRKDDKDIAVPFPKNTPTATQFPERFNYPQDELNTNPNAQEPAEGIYFVVEVNQ